MTLLDRVDIIHFYAIYCSLATLLLVLFETLSNVVFHALFRQVFRSSKIAILQKHMASEVVE